MEKTIIEIQSKEVSLYNGGCMSIGISIGIDKNASVSMRWVDAARFELESSKGAGKSRAVRVLKAVKAFFCGISITWDTAQAFVHNCSSKLAEKLEDRLIACYNEGLAESRANPSLRRNFLLGILDMKVYDGIVEEYENAGRKAELAEFRDLSSEKILAALQRSGLFDKSVIDEIIGARTDLAGSPYW